MRANLVKVVEVATRSVFDAVERQHFRCTYIKRRFSSRTSRSNHSACLSVHDGFSDVGRLVIPRGCDRNGNGLALASVAASDTDDMYDDGSGGPNEVGGVPSSSLGGFVA